MINIFISSSHGFMWRVTTDGDLVPSSTGRDTGNQGWGFSGLDFVPSGAASVGHWVTSGSDLVPI